MYLVLLYCLLKKYFFSFKYENVTSLGWTLNSGNDLAFTGILFLFFNGNNTVFVQFRQSTSCRPTISYDVLSVLFALTPIWCTCCLDRQRDMCDVLLHFVLQVTFSPLSMLLIFLQWSWWPFLPCDVLLTGNELILSERIADPNTVTIGEGIRWRLINVTFTISFIIFVIRSRINTIKLCSLSLWTTHVRIT